MDQDNLTKGERVRLDNGKTYLCLNVIEDDMRHYALLITDHEPLEMCFVEQLQDSLRVIGGREEKKRLKELFERSVAPQDGGQDA